jgi:tetratricopeptide (TPR) repeat protein
VSDRLPVHRAAALVETSPAAAMQLLAPYLASEPDDWFALCVAAQALLKLADPAQALTLAYRASGLNPTDDWPLRLQALALRNLGRFAESQSVARSSVLVSPANWQTHYMVACTDLWAQAVTDHSMAAAEKARELAPDEPRTHELVGQIALARGKSRRAVRSLEQALRLDPENSVARHELARAHLRQFRFAKSLRGFLAVGRMDPTIPQTQINLHNIAIRAMTFLHYAIFIGFLASPSAPVLSAAGLAAVAALVVTWARYRGGPPLRRFLASLWVRDRLLVVWAGMASTAGLILIVRPVLSIGHRQTGDPLPHSNLLSVVLVLLVAGIITSWIRRFRSKRR